MNKKKTLSFVNMVRIQISRHPIYWGFTGMATLILIPPLIFMALVISRRISDFYTLTQKHADILGPIGDFFGGFLNPILGLCSVILLLTTLRIQRDEFKKQELINQKQIKMLEKQAQNAEREHLRNLLWTQHKELLEQRNKIWSKEIFYVGDCPENEHALLCIISQGERTTLNQLLDNYLGGGYIPSYAMESKFKNYDWQNEQHRYFKKIHRVMEDAKQNLQILRIITAQNFRYCPISSINTHMNVEARKIIHDARCIGIYSQEEATEALDWLQGMLDTFTNIHDQNQENNIKAAGPDAP